MARPDLQYGLPRVVVSSPGVRTPRLVRAVVGIADHRTGDASGRESRNVRGKRQPALDEDERAGQDEQGRPGRRLAANEQELEAGERGRNREHEHAREFDRVDDTGHRTSIARARTKGRRTASGRGGFGIAFTRRRPPSDMFTGIVEETGEIVARERTEDGLRLRIGADAVAEGLAHGQSISVSGVCLTVEQFEEDEWFEVFLATETVERTYLGDLEEGDGVNLERAMPAEGRFDGHVVQGHVDAVATITDVESVEEDWYFEFELPEEYRRYVVEKGSITLDGISLTVADLDDETGRITVAIIPTSYELTTLSEKEVGDPVHLEVDVLAKYVERLLEERFA